MPCGIQACMLQSSDFSCHLGVAKGLLHIHSKHILHNDLKADNIALTDWLPACNGTPAHLWPIIIDFNKACSSSKGKKIHTGSSSEEGFQEALHTVGSRCNRWHSGTNVSFWCLLSDKGGSGKYLHRLAMQSTSYASMKRQELQATAIVLQSLVDESWHMIAHGLLCLTLYSMCMHNILHAPMCTVNIIIIIIVVISNLHCTNHIIMLVHILLYTSTMIDEVHT